MQMLDAGAMSCTIIIIIFMDEALRGLFHPLE
jgi:hypothetical protein